MGVMGKARKAKAPVESMDDLFAKYNILDCAILENTTSGHNKVYILMLIENHGQKHMFRFWGKHDSRSLGKKGERVKPEAKEFDHILYRQIDEGYTPVEDIKSPRYSKYLSFIDMTLEDAKMQERKSLK